MPVLVVDEDDPLFDPDDLKMPESPAHRRTVDAIALAAADLLGSEHRIYRDMNWYPPDGGNAMAPDVMVLGADAMPAPVGPVGHWPKSYRQDETGGPAPSVVVEVPSSTDDYGLITTKAHRCRRQGAVFYVVIITAAPPVVHRYVPDEADIAVWTDRPIPELGGLSIGFDEGTLVVTMPDGLRFSSDEGMAAELRGRAEQAEHRAQQAEHRAEQAEHRAEVLAAKLRDLGADPDHG